MNKQEGKASLAGCSEMSYGHSEQYKLTLTKKEIDAAQKRAILLTWTYKFGRI